MSTATTYSIIDGDCKFDLYAQAFQWGLPYSERTWLKLTVAKDGLSRTISVIITGILSKGPSGKRFKIYGFIAEKDIKRSPWLLDIQTFEAEYDTRTRKGTIKAQ